MRCVVNSDYLSLDKFFHLYDKCIRKGINFIVTEDGSIRSSNFYYPPLNVICEFQNNTVYDSCLESFAGEDLGMAESDIRDLIEACDTPHPSASSRVKRIRSRLLSRVRDNTRESA